MSERKKETKASDIEVGQSDLVLIIIVFKGNGLLVILSNLVFSVSLVP